MKYAITLPALCLVMTTLYLARVPAACAQVKEPTTTIPGISIHTRVDHPLAKELILTMANRSHSPDPEVTALLHEHSCISKEDIPATSTQRELATRYSPDSATALLLYCLLSIPEIRDTQTLFQQQLQSVSKAKQSEYLADRAQHYTILFVPGWGYLSNGDVTGSNLRAPREIIESLGYETELVALQDFGSVEDNARLLITQLKQKLRQGKKVILASASSGGPTVALALADQDIATHPRLAGWINICGVVRGSPIIDRFDKFPASLLPRTIALFEGWTYRDLRSMSQQSSEPRFAAFTPPPQLSILNYIGIPFSSQFSDTGRTLHNLLKSQGPNDGVTLVTDAMAPGHTVLALGSDHFLREDPQIDLKTAALLPVILHLIERKASLVQNGLPSSHYPAASVSATQLP